MSYRLDEGMGYCIYYIGVEDDGCHSLLDYDTMHESSFILEYIARSLNCVVLKKVMIQNEVRRRSDDEEEGVQHKDHIQDGEAKVEMENVDIECVSGEEVVKVEEEPLFQDGKYHNEEEEEEGGNHDEMIMEAKEEKTCEVYTNGQTQTAVDNTKLVKGPNMLTRCEVHIRRIETHLLDAKPISLMDVAKVAKGNALRRAHDGKDSSKLKNQEEKTSDESKSSLERITTQTEKIHIKKTGKEINTTKSCPSEKSSIGETLSERNIRIAVVGNVDAGKSTLIGTLTTSCLDDGRGRSRTSIMKHRHEIESGRTSTATTHLMGFRHTGEPIAGRDSIRVNKRKSEDEIARESYRIITLMDLAGHEKYLKTTIHGVSSGMADYSMILVNSRHPPTHMTQHHLNLCCSFGIPTIIVFTKIDGCPDHALKTSKEELFKLLRAPDVGRRPFAVHKEEDIATCIGKLNCLAPVIETSCVSGAGLDLLRKLLFFLPKRRKHEKKANRSFEFLVEDIFNVPGVGAVVSGFVNAGELTVGSHCNVYVGPTDDGTFIKTIAKSAHIARINTAHITSGQSACLAFALKKEDRLKLRRGMVVLKDSPSSTREFDAEICVLKGEGTTIRRSYQAYVHILNVRQSAFAKNIEIVNTNALGLPPSHAAHNDEFDGIVLRPGSRAKVRFEFAQRPVSLLFVYERFIQCMSNER
jgi:elongation factor 1-alpha